MAENVTNMLTVSGDVMGRLNVLKTDSIDPILDCKFISEIFSALYYPLCVEANPGFTLITISNILSGVALILAFPIAVASTKRIKAKSEDKYADEGEYKGQALLSLNKRLGSQPPVGRVDRAIATDGR